MTDEEKVPLRHYVEAHWTEHDKVHSQEDRDRAFVYQVLQQRLANLNELREEVTTDRAVYQRGDVAAAADLAITTRLDRVQAQISDMTQTLISHVGLATHPGTALRTNDQEMRIRSLEGWRSRAVGVGIVVVLFAGVIGAAIAKAFGV